MYTASFFNQENRSFLTILCVLFTFVVFHPEAAFSQEATDNIEDTAAYDRAQCPSDEYKYDGEGKSKSRFSDSCIPLQDLPDRPKPLLELGEPFLGTGTLNQGFRLPGGAVWQPALLAFGQLRTAIQTQQLSFSDSNIGDQSLTEAAVRLDLFGNLYLTSTERVVVGLTPFNEGNQFTRLTIDCSNRADCNSEDDFVDELNFDVRTLFFEGDFGELFPAFDWSDKRGLDIGISVGRQPMSFQDGLLMNENAIDAVGLTRANLKFKGLVNVRVTGLYAWGDINRTTNSFFNDGDGSASLFGLLTETDTRKSTTEIDVIYVTADELQGDGLYAGYSDIRRIGRFSNAIRVVGSFPIGDEGIRTSQGFVVTNQFSWTPYHSYNHIYINVFAGIDEFRSAARGPFNGGPLGLVGVLYSAVGIGRFPPALNSHADNAFGGAFGYQFFFKNNRQQLILELAGRHTYEGPEGLSDFVATQVAGGGRYQIAVGRRGVLVFDLFGLSNMFENDSDSNAFFVGGRFEVQVQL